MAFNILSGLGMRCNIIRPHVLANSWGGGTRSEKVWVCEAVWGQSKGWSASIPSRPRSTLGAIPTVDPLDLVRHRSSDNLIGGAPQPRTRPPTSMKFDNLPGESVTTLPYNRYTRLSVRIQRCGKGSWSRSHQLCVLLMSVWRVALRCWAGTHGMAPLRGEGTWVQGLAVYPG